MNKFKLDISLLVLLLLSCFNVHALDYNLRGFMTFGAGYHTADVNYWGRFEGEKLDFNYDSVLGLQLDVPLNNKLSATTQLLFSGNEDYEPEVGWAYISWKLDSKNLFRIGRSRAPTFLYSDSLEVGYTYPWVRPPEEVYWQIPTPYNDGLEYIYRTPVGDFDLTLSLAGGVLENDAYNLPIRIKAVSGFAILGYQDLNIRLSYSPVKITSDMRGEFRYQFAKNNIPVDADTLNEIANVDDERASFLSFGVQYEAEKLSLIGEYTNRSVDKLFAETNAWYLSAAYRIDSWQPYVLVSHIKTYDFDKRYYSGDTPFNQALEPFINQVLESAIKSDQQSTAIGVRYDLSYSAAIKFEYRKVDTRGTRGLFQSIPDGDPEFYTLTFDYVF